MKTIVTHIGPDVDAIAAVWLVKMYFPGWKEAVLAFVPAGTTLHDQPPDSLPEILHLDTGFGKFDHHQSDDDTCAARLVLAEIEKTRGENEALSRLIAVVNDIDHFRDAFYPNATADFWNLNLTAQVDGWRLLYADDPVRIVALGMDALDGIHKMFQSKVWAERELAERGVVFETRWGKGIGVETTNDEVVHTGQKMGYTVVVRKDPKKGYLRIKSLPKDDIDLTDVYNRLKQEEPDATWFFHASRHMILNGSSKNPNMRPTKKTLTEIVKVLQNS